MIKLYTVPEVAEMLRVSTGTVYTLVNKKLIRHERIGATGRGKILIPLDAIEEYRRSVTQEVVTQVTPVPPLSRPTTPSIRLKNFSLD